MPATMFSLKMRASALGRHISGAERIVRAELVPSISQTLTARALEHPLGQPDSIVVTTTAINSEEIIFLPELSVDQLECHDPRDAGDVVAQALAPVTPHAEKIWHYMTTVTGMRGAMLIDAATGERVEPDHERGVRASNMDHRDSVELDSSQSGKNYIHEARVLAAKVASCPHVVAEVCISDDPDYTTGYLCINGKYHRIENMKAPGQAIGTRAIVIDRSSPDALNEVIDYLENQVVLVG